MSKLLRAALIVVGLVFLMSGLLGIFAMIVVTNTLMTITSMPMPSTVKPGIEVLQDVLGPALAFGWIIVLLHLVAGVLSIAAGATFKPSGKTS